MSVGAVNKQTGERIPTAGMPAIDDALDLTSVNPVQNAIITAALANKQDKTDNSLQTTDKTVVGAINEHEGDISSLMSGLTNVESKIDDATVYPYADVITIEDAVPANVADCSVKIEPVQDLHGYDHPWVGGAGKNKENITLASGTYSGATWTVSDDKKITIVGSVPSGGVTLNTAIADIDTTALAGYKFVFDKTGDGAIYPRIMNSDLSSNLQDLSNGTIIADNGSSCKLVYRVVNGTSYNATISSMIVASTETDLSYAPYTNICPISGHTQASVQRDGVNLFDPINVETFDATGQGDTRYGHRYNNGTYTIVNNMASESIFVRQVKNDLSEYGQYSTINALNYATINVADGYMLYVYYQSLTEEQRRNVCVKKGNDTTFEPFKGQTYTIALNGTRYGGTLHIGNNGNAELLVDRAYVDLGTLYWEYNSDTNTMTTALVGINPPTSDAVPVNAISSICRTISANDRATETGIRLYVFAAGNVVYIRDSGYTDGAVFKNAMTGQQIVYELATPTTIQLTPQQIQLLKGQNTIYASTGQISVTVNGVSGSIGAVQEQVNDHEERIEEMESGLANLIKTTTEEITTNQYGWLYFPVNKVVIGAYIDGYNNIPLFYDSQNNRFYSRLKLSANNTPIEITAFDNNTAYTVTYMYIDNGN